jgi:hypothetical protein
MRIPDDRAALRTTARHRTAMARVPAWAVGSSAKVAVVVRHETFGRAGTVSVNPTHRGSREKRPSTLPATVPCWRKRRTRARSRRTARARALPGQYIGSSPWTCARRVPLPRNPVIYVLARMSRVLSLNRAVWSGAAPVEPADPAVTLEAGNVQFLPNLSSKSSPSSRCSSSGDLGRSIAISVSDRCYRARAIPRTSDEFP